MAASIRYNYIYNVLLNLSRVIFPLITAPYISRVLEPEGVGLFNFANTYAGYFALVALLGIPTYGIREVAKIQNDKKQLSRLVSELISLSLLTTFIVTAIYLMSIALIGQLQENQVIFLLSGFALYLAPFRMDWFFSGMEQFKFITLRTLVIRTLSIVCMFIFVRTKSDLAIYVILNVMGTVGGDIWNFIKMLDLGIKPRLTFSGLRKHLPPLLVLFTASVAISIYTVLDTLMLGFMTDYREVGFYNNAMHISRALLMVVTSLSVVAIPRISQYCREQDYGRINDLANKSLSLVSFLAFPITFGVACIAPTFVPLFFGVEFEGAVLPLMILSLLVIAIGMNNLFGMQILVAMSLDKLFLRSTLVGTVTNFILNLVLIPMYSAVGASISSVIAETLIVLVMGIFIYRNTPVRFSCSLSDLTKSFLGSLIFVPVVWALSLWLGGWLLVFVFVVCGGLLFCVTQKMCRNSALELLLPVVQRRLNF